MNLLTFRKTVKEALAEDIGFQDITSLIVDEQKKGEGYFLAKQNFVLCGTKIAELCFTELDKSSEVVFSFKDGDLIEKGKIFGTVVGTLRSILTAERVALNFLQRLSGISTVTRDVVKKVEKYGVKILDTRKTTPLMRELEKYAVKVGGGNNHRFNLSDGILIKDNHIVASGGIKDAIMKAKAVKTALVKIGVEVKNFEELKEAIESGADHIMLDNMKPEEVLNAVSYVNNRVTIEVSGGITPDNIEEYARCLPNYISLGFITHSARAVDISLELK